MIRSHENPALVDYRIGRQYTTPEDQLINLTDMSGDSIVWKCTPEQIRDAERVLERLERVS